MTPPDDFLARLHARADAFFAHRWHDVREAVRALGEALAERDKLDKEKRGKR